MSGEVTPIDHQEILIEKEYFELPQSEPFVFEDYRQGRLMKAAGLANALAIALSGRNEIITKRLTKELEEHLSSFLPPLTREEGEQIFRLARLQIDNEFNSNLKEEE